MAKSLIRLDIESREYEQKLRKSQRQFEEFTASIGINMKKMTAYGIAVGAASSAINKFTEELKECIVQSVEMAKQGEGIRQAFARLNRPDLLANLREATHGTVADLDLMRQAVKFKDFRLSLDQLGAMLAFAQKKAADTGQSVDFLVESIVNGLGRQSKLILDNLGISAAEINEEMKKTGDMTQAVGNIIKKQMAEAGDYVETAATRAAQAQANLKNAMEELGRTMMPLVEQGTNLWTAIEIGAINALNNGIKPWIEPLSRVRDLMAQVNDVTIAGSGIFDIVAEAFEGAASSAAKMLPIVGNVVSMISMIKSMIGGDGQNASGGAGAGAAISGAISAAIASGQAPKVNIPTVKSSSSKGSSKSSPEYAADSIAAQAALVNELTKQWQSAGTGLRDQYLAQLVVAEAKLKEMRQEQELLRANLEGKYTNENVDKNFAGGKNTIGVSGFKNIEGIAEELQKLFDENPIKLPVKIPEEGVKQTTKDVESMAKAATIAGDVVSSIGGAFNAIEDPAAKVMGTIAQAVASVALGYAQALTQASTMGPWAWVAFAATGLATMISSITAIHNATGYAEGGVVQGNTYSGDQIPSMLNAGEVVLTRAQAGNVASQLQEGGANRGQLVGRLRGSDIIISVERTLSKQGKGQLVTW